MRFGLLNPPIWELFYLQLSQAQKKLIDNNIEMKGDACFCWLFHAVCKLIFTLIDVQNNIIVIF